MVGDDDGELVAEETVGTGFDLDRTTVRTRDGIAYVNDPLADVGFTVDGDDVREGPAAVAQGNETYARRPAELGQTATGTGWVGGLAAARAT